MLCFPNAKINLGLYITAKRNDGYHDIITVMVPCGLSDILEFVRSDRDILTCTGLDTGACNEENLVMKALELLRSDHAIPPLHVHLHKVIPTGAGLGGGSADAAFMLQTLNSFFKLGITRQKLAGYAARLGSDCAFFIENKPALATGRGEKLEKINLPALEDHYLVLLNPGFPVSTREAYTGIIPEHPPADIKDLLAGPVESWKEQLTNQFEKTVFELHPTIRSLKDRLYQKGALYASMSGSGSTVFGIFRDEPQLSEFKNEVIYKGKLKIID